MGFSSKQVAALRRNVDGRHIRVRQSNTGRELSYLEGWFVISQANRIFGFDGWSRETLESKCVLARENRGYFTAVYTAKVRLTVEANGTSIVREGHGTGEGRGEYPGEVHDTALKAAETDATKRALATFGRPFGLELYRGVQAAKQARAPDRVRHASHSHSPSLPQVPHPVQAGAQSTAPAPVQSPPVQPEILGGQESPSLAVTAAPELSPVAKFAHDDTTPIPRPSTYFGREHYHDIREENGAVMREAAREAAQQPFAPEKRRLHSAAQPQQLPHSANLGTSPPRPEPAPSIVPAPRRQRIDKSALPLGEPKRLRDKEHLKFVAKQPCLVCGRQPSDAHHLRFAQLRALGMKVSDEFTVPLCRTHHRSLHQTGNELTWWEKARIEPLPIARKLWETSHPRAASKTVPASAAAAEVQSVAGDQTNPIAAVRS
jgi:Rad52/22 family double-strand break repair protein